MRLEAIASTIAIGAMLTGCARQVESHAAEALVQPYTPEAILTPIPTETEIAHEPVRQTVLIAGDVMLARGVSNAIRRSDNTAWPFLNIGTLLSKADITEVNLESPFGPSCQDSTGPNDIVFCASASGVEALTFAGVDVANFANNHTDDGREQGISFTNQILKEAGIAVSNEDEVTIIEKGGIRYGFCGFNRVKQSEITQIVPDDEVISRIHQYASQVDVLIVYFHWGSELVASPNENQIFLAHAAVDEGADVVIGAHQHVEGPVEMYSGAVIDYGLGNFVFDQSRYDATKRGSILALNFVDGKLEDNTVLHVEIQNHGQPVLISDIPDWLK